MHVETVMIHVRFAPDGTVTEIGERPAAVPAQAWFNLLSLKATGPYQALAGGRGVFRLPRSEIESLKGEVAA
ncbi:MULTISPECIES: hypothetical protein [Nitrospirillum]|uniref:Uncharacterized protein n=1 Tax=Nitrospirillum amazonense TaxID=28077 RepID=A0A560G9R4_9PROT|nr:hypothetical protein [Nitrospirillum amazonense]MEC4591722.1 hypothetical protein [Nitrospirillum amazonense]TWB30569.1 hypothetical protein FBZ88_102134 [Nitrospirillum amazonense]